MRSELIVTLALLAVMAVSVCGAAAEDAGYPKTIVDTAGRAVTFPVPVERIVVLNSDAAEAVVMLGAGDRIVAVTEDILEGSGHLPGVQGNPVIGTKQMGGEIDYELLGEMAIKDGANASDMLVIGFASPGKDYGSSMVEEKLSPFGIINLGLDFYQPENLSEEMTKLAYVLGREPEAERYLSWRNDRTSEAEDAVAGLNLTSVYLERSPKYGLGDLVTFGNGTGLDDLTRAAGGDNLAKDMAKSAHVSWEWVLSADPAVILRTMSSEGELGWERGPSGDTIELKETADEILSRPGAEALSSVKNERVFILDSDVLYGMESVVGLYYLVSILHPEANLDPEAVFGQYLQLLGMELPADRIFVYQEG